MTDAVETNYPTPPEDTAVNTLILFNQSRLEEMYGVTAVTNADLVNKVNTLASNPNVNGVVINLDTYPGITDAYIRWDSEPGNPQAANYVARSIKALLYDTLPAYPEVKYIVVIGGDTIIPHRRIQDTTYVGNERTYKYYDDPRLLGNQQYRYYLSDDYYAASIPYGVVGRELYLPQYAIGRLVENPAEIATMLDTYLGEPTLAPQNALITGYDFLVDQANEINATFQEQGLNPANVDTLINNTWTAADFRNAALDAQSYDLISLNSHFDHFRFFPNDRDNVLAAEFEAVGSNFNNTLIFSVGCHSGLNVDNNGATFSFTGSDYAQIFARNGATFLGNTGFGYGDGDLLAYSERLMVNFSEQLGYNPAPGQVSTLPTVGTAMLEAKQRYLNSLGNGGLTNYDEKVLGEMTLYGLPMLKVNMPTQTSQVPGGDSVLGSTPQSTGPGDTTIWDVDLTFAYDSHVINNAPYRQGTYYTIQGENGLLSTGSRPLLPLTTRNFSSVTDVAHGVLMLGGTFTDSPNFDPIITEFITQEVTLDAEGFYPVQQLYPLSPASMNRFLTGDDISQRLVVVPAQFQTTNTITPTVGTLRLYDSLDLLVYTASFTETDFLPPNVWSVTANAAATVDFTVELSDKEAGVYRTVVLYRDTAVSSWSNLDLTYDAGTGLATGSIPLPSGTIEYFVQAVDNAGNVALVLDHGLPFRILSATADGDGDGIADNTDNCLLVANNNQADLDGDGLGDSCDFNKDGDAVADIIDQFPDDPTEWWDIDGDGIGDNADNNSDNDSWTDDVDNCDYSDNEDQLNTDGDAYGDACDLNDDNDPIPDAFDKLPIDPTEWLDFDEDGIGDFTDTDDDNDGIIDSEDPYPLNVPPAVVDDTLVADGTAVSIDITSNDTDKDGNLVPATASITIPPSHGTLVNDGNGTFTYTPTAGYIGSDSFAYEVCDSEGLCDTGTVNITVVGSVNNQPTVGEITAPAEPIQLGTAIDVAVDYEDVDTNDSLTVTWDWGDGSSTTDALATVSGTAAATHDYAETGVYTVQVTIEDAEGETAVTIYQYVVIYDSAGGFVTGGGWIDSQAGWCTFNPECEQASGRANFGFVAKYKKGASIPIGNTQFQFQAGGFNFHSDTYQWLVINQGGTNAQFKGSGTINGQADPNGNDYKFMIWAKDSNPDTFRIKIWWEDNNMENEVYDTGVKIPIAGGSIKIHQK